MFKTTLTLVLALLLSSTVLAEERFANASDQQVVTSGENEALEIMRDHMRSQMDWRSYFTDRMEVQRRARALNKKLRSEPRAAGVEQPH